MKRIIPLTILFLLTCLPTMAQRGPDIAPATGAPIPQVTAKTIDGQTSVTLAEPKRLTVLIFGSHT
ncbi:MAG: hypothetical protein ACSHX0_01520 [Akkermansiaceae bacterium]